MALTMADPATIAAKWAQNLQGAGQAYKDGIMRVTESPMQKAAQNKQGYINGVMEAANSGKWEAGLNRVSLQQWKDAASTAGAARLGSGAQLGKPKMQAFLQQFLPVLANNVAQVRSMPADSFEARKARAIAMMDLNHSFKRS